MKASLFYILIILSVVLNLSCQNGKSEQQGGKNEVYLTLKENELGWVLDDKVFKPQKIQGSITDFNHFRKFILTGFDGSEGVSLLVNCAYGELLGEHTFGRENYGAVLYANNGIRLNTQNGDILEVYNSGGCETQEGKIVITDYDDTFQEISGWFKGTVCTTSASGEIEKKVIQRGEFYSVPISVLTVKK